MKIEAGKRYVRRDGKITKVIENDPDPDRFYEFFDDAWQVYYSEDGKAFDDVDHEYDIVAEYIEPPSQESIEIKVLRAEVAELTAALETLSKAFVVAQETLCDLVPMVLAIKHQLNVNDIVDEWDIENSKERFKQQATK